MKENGKINSIADLLKASRAVQVVNLVTLYRIVTFPLIILFVFLKQVHVFKWLLIASFLTDAVDGYLARRFKATSVFGAKLDSIGDDLTILAALTAILVLKPEFIREEIVLISIQLGLLIVQLTAGLIRYGKLTSFHTYLAKLAAMLQGFFVCSFFLFDTPTYWLFYAASAVTIIELVEEIAIVLLRPEWKANVKGLYWVLRK